MKGDGDGLKANCCVMREYMFRRLAGYCEGMTVAPFYISLCDPPTGVGEFVHTAEVVSNAYCKSSYPFF